MNYILRIFNYRFYLKEFLILFFGYLLLEGIFSWLFVPTSVVVLSYEKILGFIIYAFMLYSFPKLSIAEKVYTGLFTALLIKLVIESLYKYDSFFQQLTMFYVLFPVIFSFFIKYICRSLDLDILEFIAKFYLITYIVFMAVYGRGLSFSLEGIDMDDYGPFSGDGRIIHARSVYMMIIPFLWYLNKLINTRKNKYLLPVLFCVIIFVVHQHRSVWSSALAALFLYTAASLRNKIISLPRIWNLLIGAVIVIMIALFFITNLYPGFADFMAERFGEIFDPSKEGSTGNFRIEQRETYFALFLQRPIFGWTFEGFEMSNPLVDWWPEKTGQHFHEGYMEMLFYHGIAGLLFKYSVLIYILYKSFSKKLTENSIILISFCASGLLFSLNYVLPLIFWGHAGLCLYYLEKEKMKQPQPVE